VAWAVNISELPVKYRRNISVGNSNGKYRRNISVGDCGMGGNFFASLGKISTACFHLEIRQYLFKILKKIYLLTGKKLNNQIKLY
jgi:hypothetical protein